MRFQNKKFDGDFQECNLIELLMEEQKKVEKFKQIQHDSMMFLFEEVIIKITSNSKMVLLHYLIGVN